MKGFLIGLVAAVATLAALGWAASYYLRKHLIAQYAEVSGITIEEAAADIAAMQAGDHSRMNARMVGMVS